MSDLCPPRIWNEDSNGKSLGLLGLTPRESEVLEWVAQGKTNYEIGLILGASTGTVSKHVEHILTKLNVENRTSAAAVAFTTLHRSVELS